MLERLPRLAAPEREIIELRLSFACPHLTTERMARLLGMTPEQVGRIERQAWAKLCHPSSLPPR